MKFEEFDDAAYTALRKNLIRKKGSDEQKTFLQALRTRERFIEYIHDKVKITKGETLLILPRPITESDYKEPPKDSETHIFKHWQSVKPAYACRTTFWALLTLRNIEECRIKPYFLAANGGVLPGGLQRIDQALANSDANHIDVIVRTALRRLGGLPEARGNRSVYVNCPFARAWWHQYLANEICKDTNANKKNIIQIFRHSQDYWEKLILSIVSRNSILGDTKVRNALIWALSELLNDKKMAHLFKVKKLEQVCKHIGLRSAWQELAIYPIEELKKIMENEFLKN